MISNLLRFLAYSSTLIAAALIAGKLIATLRRQKSLLSFGMLYLFLAAAFQNFMLATTVLIIIAGGFGTMIHQTMIDLLAIPTLAMAAAMWYLVWVVRIKSR